MNATPRVNKSVCKSCNARIVWARTPAGKVTPVDVEPSSDGDHVLITGPQGWLAVRVHATVSPDTPRFKSHFATCPNADSHRRERTKGARP